MAFWLQIVLTMTGDQARPGSGSHGGRFFLQLLSGIVDELNADG